jgi:GNAT superfamily N-acetyltransferase
MPFLTQLSRVKSYYIRHGLWPTLVRGYRGVFSGTMMLYYCDIAAFRQAPVLPSGHSVERKRNEAEISSLDLQRYAELWNPVIAKANMRERFGRSASLWLLQSEGTLVGYGWTLGGGTIEPHFFRLGRRDVHLFDFYVAPAYRGRGLNPLLVNSVLCHLALEGCARAFIETPQWNHSQISSLKRTPFHFLGSATKWTLAGRATVWWGPAPQASYATSDESSKLDESSESLESS